MDKTSKNIQLSNMDYQELIKEAIKRLNCGNKVTYASFKNYCELLENALHHNINTNLIKQYAITLVNTNVDLESLKDEELEYLQSIKETFSTLISFIESSNVFIENESLAEIYDVVSNDIRKFNHNHFGR